MLSSQNLNFESGSWKIHLFVAQFLLRCGRRYTFLLLICILHFDQTTLACDLHVEDPQKRTPPLPYPKKFCAFVQTGTRIGLGSSIRGQMSDRWGDLGELPSESLVTSPFPVPFLHFCAFMQVLLFPSRV